MPEPPARVDIGEADLVVVALDRRGEKGEEIAAGAHFGEQRAPFANPAAHRDGNVVEIDNVLRQIDLIGIDLDGAGDRLDQLELVAADVGESGADLERAQLAEGEHFDFGVGGLEMGDAQFRPAMRHRRTQIAGDVAHLEQFAVARGNRHRFSPPFVLRAAPADRGCVFSSRRRSRWSRPGSPAAAPVRQARWGHSRWSPS